MKIFDAIRANLLSSAVLFFVLGLIAALTKSDLKFTEPLYIGFTIYPLIAIGFKDGVAIAEAGLAKVWLPAPVAMALGALIPLWTYPVCCGSGELPGVDAAAIAAHYSSVAEEQHAAFSAFLDDPTAETKQKLLITADVSLTAPRYAMLRRVSCS